MTEKIANHHHIRAVARRTPIQQRIGSVSGIVIARDLFVIQIINPQKRVERQTEGCRAQSKLDFVVLFHTEPKAIFIARRINPAIDRTGPMQRLRVGI